jgi:hypothetical protein
MAEKEKKAPRPAFLQFPGHVFRVNQITYAKKRNARELLITIGQTNSFEVLEFPTREERDAAWCNVLTAIGMEG